MIKGKGLRFMLMGSTEIVRRTLTSIKGKSTERRFARRALTCLVNQKNNRWKQKQS
jgi:hypothetical protein